MKPILFSTPMVQAILRGEKTQTRRIVKFKKEIEDPLIGWTTFTEKGYFSVRGKHKSGEYGESFFKMKYQTGDILWIRETWQKLLVEGGGFGYTYKANDHPFDRATKWKPSIFMPKEAARIFLKVTKVRVERLQDIQEEDAIAEGVEIHKDKKFYLNYVDQKHHTTQFIYNCRSVKDSFKSLWWMINGKDNWFENPWVWVYDFEKTEKPQNI